MFFQNKFVQFTGENGRGTFQLHKKTSEMFSSIISHKTYPAKSQNYCRYLYATQKLLRWVWRWWILPSTTPSTLKRFYLEFCCKIYQNYVKYLSFSTKVVYKYYGFANIGILLVNVKFLIDLLIESSFFAKNIDFKVKSKGYLAKWRTLIGQSKELFSW